MTYNPLDYLKKGRIDFIYNLTPIDRQNIIARIRQRSDCNEIINGFLKKALPRAPFFCFDVIYDKEDYKEITQFLLKKYQCLQIKKTTEISNILNKTSWGQKYVLSHLSDYYQDEEALLLISDYALTNLEKNKELIHKLAFNHNLHVRFIFMNFLVENHPEIVDIIYDDLLKYLTIYTHQANEQIAFLPLMDMEDICKLAVNIYESPLDYTLWLRIKEFILKNYEFNNLAKELITKKVKNEAETSITYEPCPKNLEELYKDGDRLFLSSYDAKYLITTKYSKAISQDILARHLALQNKFIRDGYPDYYLKILYEHNLAEKLASYVDKYLSLSQSQKVTFLNKGTTASVYRLGDYIIKLVKDKWSYEDIICPNLYLILKNLEEIYIRNDLGYIVSGIEVQPFLTRKAQGLPIEVYDFFHTELSRLGYYYNDRLISEEWGDNCFLLNSYKDANHPNPEELPAIFKEYPIVLVDHDRIYRLNNHNPKQR